MSDAATTGILATIGKTLGYILYGWAVYRYEKSKESPVVCLVMTTGKTKFVENYKAEFGLNSDAYMVDIEDEIMKDPKNANLAQLKEKDIVMYEAKMFTLAKEHLKHIVDQLKQMRVKKTIVVLCSSNDMKKYLEIKRSFYYTPVKRLFAQIETKNPNIKEYLNYTRNLLNEKQRTYIFSSFEELYNQVLQDLKIVRTVS